MKAPEKIWGSRYDKQWSFADCTMTRCDETQAYIREDVAQAMLAKAREDALREAESAVSELRMQNHYIVMQWNEAIDSASERIEALNHVHMRRAASVALKLDCQPCKKITHWYCKPIKELTREELIEVVEWQAEQMERHLELFFSQPHSTERERQ